MPLTLVATASTENSEYLPGYITTPGATQPGDIILYAEKCSNPDYENGQPIPNPTPLTVKTPAGYEPINIIGQEPDPVTHYFSWFWKIAEQGDANKRLNDLPGGITTGFHSNRRVMAVLRPSAPITSISFVAVPPSFSEGNPGSLVIPSGDAIFAVYGAMGGTVNPRTASAAKSFEVTVPDNNAIFLAGWLNPSGPITIDMDDEGTWNALLGVTVTLNGEPQQPSEPILVPVRVYREEIDGVPTGDFLIDDGANRRRLVTEVP